jgi:hypothetical protein
MVMMTDPVWETNIFIAIGLLFAIGVIAVIIIEAQNE